MPEHISTSYVPETAVWEITLNCNMQCIHCGSTAIPGIKREKELTTEEALDLIRQLAELGTRRIVLSGGEPLIRKDWFVLAGEIARLGMVPSFISNGYLITDDTAMKIKSLGERAHIGISIDGTEEVHDHIRQRKGSFLRVLRALEILTGRGVQSSVITQVNKLNLGILPDIRDTIFTFPIYGWQLQLATPWGRLNKNLILTPKQYISFISFIAEQKEIFGAKIYAADDIGYFTRLESTFRPQGEWQGCHAGIRVIGLTSNGGVMGCLSLQDHKFLEGNVRERPLKDIWNDPKAFAYNRQFKEEWLEGFCKTCHHRLQCKAGCHNTAYSTEGTLFKTRYCAHQYMMQQTSRKPARKPARKKK